MNWNPYRPFHGTKTYIGEAIPNVEPTSNPPAGPVVPPRPRYNPIYDAARNPDVSPLPPVQRPTTPGPQGPIITGPQPDRAPPQGNAPPQGQGPPPGPAPPPPGPPPNGQNVPPNGTPVPGSNNLPGPVEPNPATPIPTWVYVAGGAGVLGLGYLLFRKPGRR